MPNKDELIRVLYQQVDILQQLVEAMHEEQRSVVTMQYDGVRSSITSGETLMLKLRRLEQRRLELLKELTGLPEKDVEKYSLTELIAGSSKEHASTLRSLQRQYKALLKKLNTVNETNRVLIDHSRRFIQSTIRILTLDHERSLVDHRV